MYHGQPKLKHVVMITDAMEQVPAKAQLVTTPYLIVSGDQDVITPVGPMKVFHSAVPHSTDKSFKVRFLCPWIYCQSWRQFFVETEKIEI